MPKILENAMRMAVSILSLLLLLLPMINNQAMAQAVVECNVVYRYKDQKNAVREQQWEDGWSWSIEGPNSSSFSLLQSSATKAKFDITNGIRGAQYTITFKNSKDQSNAVTFAYSGSPNDKIIMTIIKYYNKVILKNKNNQTVTGVVYLGRSGITDYGTLKNGDIGFRCPPASNGGYSFPSISQEHKTDYSLYIPDTKNGFKEYVFKSKNWYEKPMIVELTVE